jgi:hypothetical protein
MQLRYSFRVYPSAGQRTALARAFGCARAVFNDALRVREEARAAGRPFVTSAELSKRLTAAKKTPQRAWLGEVSAVILQQSLRDLDTAAGTRRIWWALAGTAVLAASVAGGLLLSGTLPLKNQPEATTTSRVVRAASGWQSVAGVSIQRGDRIVVRFVSGEWTADHRMLPMTGPAGYEADTDQLPVGTKACKVKASAPYGALLVRLAGDENFPVHTVDRRLTFRAAADAALQLGINDAAGLCSEDDKGTLTVQVTVTRQR